MESHLPKAVGFGSDLNKNLTATPPEVPYCISCFVVFAGCEQIPPGDLITAMELISYYQTWVVREESFTVCSSFPCPILLLLCDALGDMPMPS